MTAPTHTEDRAELHPVELDLLCSYVEVEPPFPLQVASVGHTDTERRMVFAAAREQLAGRGLADRYGPAGLAADLVDLLGNGAGTVDLVLNVDGRDLGALALISRGRALLLRQRPDEPGGLVSLRALDSDAVVPELLRYVPELPRAGVPPYTVPLRPIRRLFDELLHRLPANGNPPAEPLSPAELDDLMLSNGVDQRAAQRLTRHLRSVTGSGQLGAARPTGTEDCWARVPGSETRWVDTELGRFRLASADDSPDAEWLSVNPLSKEDLRGLLRGLVATARAS